MREGEYSRGEGGTEEKVDDTVVGREVVFGNS